MTINKDNNNEKQLVSDSDDFSFNKTSKYIFAYLFLSFGPYSSGGFIHGMAGVTAVHVVVCEIFIILPIHFFIILIGHYSGSSCVAIGWISPILTGFAYSMLLNTLFVITMSIIMLRLLIIYMLYAVFLAGDPIQKCHIYDESLSLRCLDILSTTQHINASSHPNDIHNLPSSIFFRYIYESNYNGTSLMALRVGTQTMYIALGALLPLLFYIMSLIPLRKIAKHYEPLTKFLFVFFIFQLIVLPLTGLPGAWDGVYNVFSGVTDFKRYISIEVWLSAVNQRINAYDPMLIHHMTFASFLHRKADPEAVAITSWGFILLADFIRSMYLSMMQGVLRSTYRIATFTTKFSTLHLAAIVFPCGVDCIPTGDNAILTVFYTTFTVAWVIAIATNVNLCFRCLVDIYPRVNQYKKYITAFVMSILLAVVALVFSSNLFYKKIYSFRTGQLIPNWFYTFILLFFVLWFYGVNNLCDDYHFKSGSPVSFYWKLTLWPMPLVLLVALFISSSEYDVESVNQMSSDLQMLFKLTIAIYVAPFVLCTVIVVIHYILKKKMMTLVKPQERWGDPDPQERLARQIYPPKLETKFRRRYDYCKHRCLRYNKVLKALIEKEERTRMALFTIPQEIIYEKDYIYKVLERLRKQEQVSTKM